MKSLHHYSFPLFFVGETRRTHWLLRNLICRNPRVAVGHRRVVGNCEMPTYGATVPTTYAISLMHYPQMLMQPISMIHTDIPARTNPPDAPTNN